MRPTRTLLLTALLAGCAVGLLACNGGSSATDGPQAADTPRVTSPASAAHGDVTPATAAMARRLADVRAAADPEKDGFLSDRRAELFQSQLARGGLAPEAEVQLRAQLGNELLSSNRPREAVVELEAALAQLQAGKGKAMRSMSGNLQELLALAWLRLGEQQNCIVHHGTEACLAPIAGNGLHTDTEGSVHARDVLTTLLTERPDNLAAMWMLNIAHMTLGTWPDGVPEEWRIPEQAFASDDDIGRFVDHAKDWGIDTMGLCGGVAMEDFDRDGDLDLMVSSWSLGDPIRYLRHDGAAGYTDATVSAGLDGITGGLNLVHADYDNDGLPDVFVLRGAWRKEQGRYPNSLLRNRGGGRFEDVTEAAGLLSFHPTQTAAWGDYDDDGWLDLFVGNETVPAQNQSQHPSELWHNDGDGGFTDVAQASGVTVLGYAKGTAWGDYDDDGDLDLFVSLNSGLNRLYRNDGPRQGERAGPVPLPPEGAPRAAAAPARPWRFTEVATAAGVAEPFASFPCWFFDYDNDGRLDLWVSGYEYFSVRRVAKDYLGRPHKGTLPHLYRNLGGGRFEDLTQPAGLDVLLLTMGANFGDLDNDGYEDLYAGTGEPDFMALYPNRMFRNDGNGRFLDVTTSGGFGHLQKGHGVAFGDIDQDGDQDVYAVMGGAYSGDAFQNALFENPGHGARWITLRLTGRATNRDAFGARVEVVVRRPDGSTRSIHRQVGTGGSFGSQSLQQEIGLGDAAAIEQLVVRWPASGLTTRIVDVPLDRVLTLVEGEQALGLVASQPIPRPGAR